MQIFWHKVTIAYLKSNKLDGWHWGNATRTDFLKYFTNDLLEQHHGHAMLNFFRMSQQYLIVLDEVYTNILNEEWIFFESLFPTVVSMFNMTWDVYHHPFKSMRFRPCYTSFPEEGMYHPVKYRNGQYFPCHCFEADSSCYNINKQEKNIMTRPECKQCLALIRNHTFDLSLEEKRQLALIEKKVAAILNETTPAT